MRYYYSFGILPLILCEIVASLGFIALFGFGKFVLFLIICMLFGVVILAIFWKNVLEFRIGTAREMFANFAFVIAGFLLVCPGVLSSIFGAFVLIFGLVFNAGKRQKNNFKTDENSEIIDVEIIEDKK